MGRRVIMMTMAGVLALAACSSDGDEGPDASTRLACSTFYGVVEDIKAGVLTSDELRSRLQEVYDNGRDSTVADVKAGSTEALAAATGGTERDLAEAVTQIDRGCTAATT